MTNRTISTRNFQTGLTYDFLITKMPETSFFLQEFQIPEISCPSSIQYNIFNPVSVPGVSVEYSPASCTFLLQEGMKNWYEIYAWIHGLNFPQKFAQYVRLKNTNQQNFINDLTLNLKENKQNLYSEIKVIIKSSQGNPLIAYTFVDAFPISLSGPILSSNSGSTEFLTFSANFEYSYFTISDEF